MEILKRLSPLLVVLGLAPFTMGNKGCKDGTTWEHPPVARTADCSECHDATYSPKNKPTWHDANFSREHGELTRRHGFSTKNNCTVCHAQTWCSDCHQQNAPKDHNQFFRMKSHGLYVGMDRSRCQTCHQTSFCQDCHKNTVPQNHAAGWGNPGNRHCVTCHLPIESAGAQACATCHLSTSSHALAPKRPTNSLHNASANCQNIGCHARIGHAVNGMNCVVCHSQ